MDEHKIRQKCEFFQERKTIIHIRKNNQQFYNGLILEVNDEFLIIQDRIVGEVLIYYEEINLIEPYKEKGENSNAKMV